jgi:putative nucleotidyltransferase with HDIG domain
MKELDDFINRVKHLPPAPRVLPELLALLRDDDVDTDRVVKVIAYDPSLTAAVLQLCNSAFYAPASRIGDLSQAITWLGFKQVYQLVTAVIGARTLGGSQKGYGIDQGELWQHAVASAVAAQLLARKLGDDESIIFTAALLHDVGKIILSEALEGVYAKLLDETEKQHRSLLESEKAVLGVQHAEVGGRLLSRWKFPDVIVSAVWFHHQPKGAAPHERVAACVHLGNVIAHFLGHSYGHQALALRGRADALEILNLKPEDLPLHMMETVEQLAQVNAMFRSLA